jgi:hypothetical protein
MIAEDLRKLLKAEPFEPLCIGLSDGRAVHVFHPDQVVVSQRHVYVGLARIARSAPLATPRRPGAIAKDWLWVNILHVATVEQLNGGRVRGQRSVRARRGRHNRRL